MGTVAEDLNDRPRGAGVYLISSDFSGIQGYGDVALLAGKLTQVQEGISEGPCLQDAWVLSCLLLMETFPCVIP